MLLSTQPQWDPRSSRQKQGHPSLSRKSPDLRDLVEEKILRKLSPTRFGEMFFWDSGGHEIITDTCHLDYCQLTRASLATEVCDGCPLPQLLENFDSPGASWIKVPVDVDDGARRWVFRIECNYSVEWTISPVVVHHGVLGWVVGPQ